MRAWYAEASNIRPTPVGLDADVRFTEENGDVFHLRASLIGHHIQIAAEDGVMNYLNERYTPQAFSFAVRDAILSKADS